MFEPLPEADAIVSTSFFKNRTLGVPDSGPVERVIGLTDKMVNADQRSNTGGGRDRKVSTWAGCPRRGATTTTTASAPFLGSSSRAR